MQCSKPLQHVLPCLARDEPRDTSWQLADFCGPFIRLLKAWSNTAVCRLISNTTAGCHLPLCNVQSSPSSHESSRRSSRRSSWTCGGSDAGDGGALKTTARRWGAAAADTVSDKVDDARCTSHSHVCQPPLCSRSFRRPLAQSAACQLQRPAASVAHGWRRCMDTCGWQAAGLHQWQQQEWQVCTPARVTASGWVLKWGNHVATNQTKRSTWH